MRLAAFTDYGLRILMRLAGTPDELLTTACIAEEFQISYNHLTKVVLDLSRGDFVTTQRGAGGGIRLARPADAITLGEVVRRLDDRYDMSHHILAVWIALSRRADDEAGHDLASDGAVSNARQEPCQEAGQRQKGAEPVDAFNADAVRQSA